MTFYEWFHDAGGETFEITRGDTTVTADGIHKPSQKLILFSPDTDIQEGDWVKSVRSGDEFHVLDTHSQSELGGGNQVFSRNASYETKAQYDRRMAATPQAPNVNVGIAIGSVVGNMGGQADIRGVVFNVGELETEIDQKAGPDAEALKQIVREIRDTLEERGSVDRGFLMKFSEELGKHDWLTAPIAQMLFIYALTGQVS